MNEKQKYKILILDDDKFLLDMYAVKFTQSNFEVTSSLGSADALAKLKEGLKPDVILTDVLMPSMDGFEFIKKVKDEHLAEQSKIIVLSNKGEKEDIDRGIELGATGYIVKASAVPSEVVSKVTEMLRAQ